MYAARLKVVWTVFIITSLDGDKKEAVNRSTSVFKHGSNQAILYKNSYKFDAVKTQTNIIPKMDNTKFQNSIRTYDIDMEERG